MGIGHGSNKITARANSHGERSYTVAYVWVYSVRDVKGATHAARITERGSLGIVVGRREAVCPPGTSSMWFCKRGSRSPLLLLARRGETKVGDLVRN